MFNFFALAAPVLQDDGGGIIAALFSSFFGLCGLLFAILAVVGLWKTFQKAGEPGWAAIIPFYNVYVLLKIAGRPGWWLLLFFVPFVNVVVSIILSIDVARAFGKDTVFGIVLLWFLNAIGYIILGFGDAQYVGAKKI